MIKKDACTIEFGTGQTYIDKTKIHLFLEHITEDSHLGTKKKERKIIGQEKILINCKCQSSVSIHLQAFLKPINIEQHKKTFIIMNHPTKTMDNLTIYQQMKWINPYKRAEM